MTNSNDEKYGLENPLRILVVDDSETNIMLAENFLKKLGYEADSVKNGTEALKQLEKKEYDLIFMDAHMPQMGGVECTMKIRETYKNQHYIVALTASDFPEDRKQFSDCQMDDYMSKPITLQNLHGAIQKAIDKKTSSTLSYAKPLALEEYFLGNEKLMHRFIDSFQESYPQLFDSLEQAVKNKNLGEIKHSAHTLQGLTSYFGNDALQKTLIEIQHTNEESNFDEVARQVKLCKNMTEEIIPE